MTELLDVRVTVLSFDEQGFIDHEGDGYSRYDVAVLRIDAPSDLAGRELTLAIDTPIEGETLLRVAGEQVRFQLTRDLLDLDVLFSAAVQPNRIERFVP